MSSLRTVLLSAVFSGGASQFVVTTFAGGGSTGGIATGDANGVGTAATFSYPLKAAVDASGNAYVTDMGNHLVRLVTNSGLVSTFAGGGGSAFPYNGHYAGFADGVGTNALFYSPYGIVLDDVGANLYVAEYGNNGIRRIVVSTATVSTLAGGSGSGRVGYVNGIGTAAEFNLPYGLAMSSGLLFVADTYNCLVRQIDPSSGAVTTLVGGGGGTTCGFADGLGTSATFHNPAGMAADTAGSLYIADWSNNLIRRVNISSLAVTTLAGSLGQGSSDGLGASASFNAPTDVATDNNGTLFVIDSGTNRVRQVSGCTGQVTTLSGGGSAAGNYSNGVGSAVTFLFSGGVIGGNYFPPAGGVSVGTNLLLVVDSGDNLLRRINTSFAVAANPASCAPVPSAAPAAQVAGRAVTTLAGSGSAGHKDGMGTGASFQMPAGIAVDSSGVVYVTDMLNNCVRQVTAAGYVSTLAGGGSVSGTAAGHADGVGTAATFSSPMGAAVDSSGHLYVTENGNHLIRVVVTGTGTVSTLAGGGSAGGTTSGNADGTGTAATFFLPSGAALDSTGSYLYVADTGNNVVRLVVVGTGVVSTLAGGGSAGGTASGHADGTGVAATFSAPFSVAADSSGNVFVADRANDLIRSIVVSSAAVSTLAGGGSVGGVVAGSADGMGTAAGFAWPMGIAVDASGNLFVSDYNNNILRQIIASNGSVSTVAGGGSLGGTAAGHADGLGAAATFTGPLGVAVASNGLIAVADSGNNRIRLVGNYTAPVASASPSMAASSTGGAAASQTGGGTSNDTFTSTATGSSTSSSTSSGSSTSTPTSTSSSSATATETTASSKNSYTVTTVAGGGSAGEAASGHADGVGQLATFHSPCGVAADVTGRLFVADTSNNRIRLVTLSTGNVSTLAGSSTTGHANGVGTLATFGSPVGVAIDASNTTLYVTESFNNLIRQVVISSGNVTTLAGGGDIGWGSGYADGVGSLALFYGPRGIAADNAGKLYVVDSSNNLIRQITIVTRAVITLAGNTDGGSADGTGTEASFYFPYSAALDPSCSYLYVTDGYNGLIRTIVIATAVVSTLAGGNGTGGIASVGNVAMGYQDGTGTAALFSYPYGIAVDPSGNTLFVTDGNNLIRKIVRATGDVITIAGGGSASGVAYGLADGVGTAATFNNPTGMAINALGTVYISDQSNNLIREIIVAPASTATATATGTSSNSSTSTSSSTASSSSSSTSTSTSTTTGSSSSTSTSSGTSTSTSTSTMTGSSSSTSTGSGTSTRTSTSTTTGSSSSTSTGSGTSTGTATSTTTGSSSSTSTGSGTNTGTATSTTTGSSSSTSTSSGTSTGTATSTMTGSSSSTSTSSGTSSGTATSTTTGSSSSTSTSSGTSTGTATSTMTGSSSLTSTSSSTSTGTSTSSSTSSSSVTSTATRTASLTVTASASGSLTRSGFSTPSKTAAVTGSRSPSRTATASNTDTLSGTASFTGSVTRSPSSSSSLSGSTSVTGSTTGTSSVSPSRQSATASPASYSSTPSAQSATSSPSATATSSATSSSTATSSETSTSSSTASSTSTSSSTSSSSSSSSATSTSSSTSSATSSSSSSATSTSSSTSSATGSATATSSPAAYADGNSTAAVFGLLGGCDICTVLGASTAASGYAIVVGPLQAGAGGGMQFNFTSQVRVERPLILRTGLSSIIALFVQFAGVPGVLASLAFFEFTGTNAARVAALAPLAPVSASAGSFFLPAAALAGAPCSDNAFVGLTLGNASAPLPGDSTVYSMPFPLCPAAPVPAIRVTSPASGATYAPGDTVTVAWSSARLPWTTFYDVALVTVAAGGAVTATALAAPLAAWPGVAPAVSLGGAGSNFALPVTVPGYVPLLGQYYAFAVQVAGGGESGYAFGASAPVLLVDPLALAANLSVSQPAYGEVVAAGVDNVTLVWATVGLSAADTLLVYLVDTASLGAAARQLGTVSATLGSLTMVTPDVAPSASYAFELQHSAIASIYAFSDTFVIIPAAGAAAVAVVVTLPGADAPLNASSPPVVQGATVVAAWAFSDALPYAAQTIVVELWNSLLGYHDPAYDVFVATLATVPVASMGGALNGSTLCAVPTDPLLWASPAYFARVYVAEQPYVAGASDYLAVVVPTLVFSSPSAAAPMLAGAHTVFSWTTNLPPGSAAFARVTLDLYIYSSVAGAPAFLMRVAAGVPTAALALPVAVPASIYSGFYQLWAYDGADFASSALQATSDLFAVTAAANITVAQPNATAQAAHVAGSVLTLMWTSSGLPESAQVDVVLLDAASGRVVLPVAAGAPNSFFYDVVLPLSDVAWNGSAQPLRLSVSSGSVVGLSGLFSVAAPAATLTVSQPASGATWQAGVAQTVLWSATGVPAGALCSVGLWINDRFAGDRQAAALAANASCAGGFALYTVAANLSSVPIYYVVVSVQNGSAGGLWGRSDTFYVSAAPVPSYAAFRGGVLCAAFPAGLPAATRAALCAPNCSACVAGGGVWLVGVTLQLTLALTGGFLGSPNDALQLTNALGAFQSVGESACWPMPAVGGPNASITQSLSLGPLPSVTAAIATLAPGSGLTHIATLTAVLNGPGATNCSALSTVTATYALPGMPSGTDDAQVLAAFTQAVVAGAAGGPGAAPVAPSSVDVTVTVVASAAATNATGSGRRLDGGFSFAPPVLPVLKSYSAAVRVRTGSDAAGDSVSRALRQVRLMVAGRAAAVAAPPVDLTATSVVASGSGIPRLVAMPALSDNRPLTGTGLLLAALAGGTYNSPVAGFVAASRGARGTPAPITLISASPSATPPAGAVASNSSSSSPVPAVRGGSGGGGASPGGLSAGQEAGLGLGIGFACIALAAGVALAWHLMSPRKAPVGPAVVLVKTVRM